jgi:hypothetical protein
VYLALLLRLRRELDRAIDLAALAAADADDLVAQAKARARPRTPQPPAAVVEAPAPPAEAPAVEDPADTWVGGVHAAVVREDLDLLVVGEDKHAQIVELWLKNWRVDGAPQPDRVNTLMSAYTGWLRPWREYIRDRGGLVQATRDVLVRRHLCAVEDALSLAKAIAQEMAAVGSTANLPIDGFLEVSLFTDPHGPPTGGCVADSAKMDRPRY